MSERNIGHKQVSQSRLKSFALITCSTLKSVSNQLRLLRALVTVTVGFVALIGCTPQLKSDTGKEADDLVATYTRLQRAIKDQNLQVAYSLMSKSYQLTGQFNEFEAGHKAVPNSYLAFDDDSIVKVNGSKGDIMIKLDLQKQYWNVYSFVKEGQEWRCTGNERTLTRGWD